MFKKGQKVVCINAGIGKSLVEGKIYTVAEDTVVDSGMVTLIGDDRMSEVTFYASRFKPATKAVATEGECYTLKLSSPDLLDYQRMYDETMVDGVRVAKVTIKAEGKDDAYLLMVHDRIWDKAGLQKGGDEIVRQLDVLGVSRYEAGPLTIKVWASAYELVKRLVKLPLLPEFKAETVVIVEPLEV